MSETKPLDLPTSAPKTLTHERERRDNATDEARLLSEVGTRLKPDGVKYVGSFATHIYHLPLMNEYVFYCQSTDLRTVPETVALDAVKEQARALALKYGHKPPKRNDEPNDN